MIVRLSLVLERETTVRHVVQILQPFEEGYSNTTGVDIQVRNNEDVPIYQNLISGRGGRSIGSFGNDFSLQKKRRSNRIYFLAVR